MQNSLCVVTAYNDKHAELLDITRSIYQSYCNKHNFKFIEYQINNFDRPPSWFKIKAILNLFKNSDNDYALWCDADTMILNLEYDISKIINTEKDFYVSRDNLGINCGVFLMKNTPFIYHLLQTIDNLYPRYHNAHPLCGIWEQAAVWELCAINYQNILSKIQLIPQYILNAYDPANKPLEKNGHVNKDTFILHVPNTSYNDRKNILLRYRQNYYGK